MMRITGISAINVSRGSVGGIDDQPDTEQQAPVVKRSAKALQIFTGLRSRGNLSFAASVAPRTARVADLRKTNATAVYIGKKAKKAARKADKQRTIKSARANTGTSVQVKPRADVAVKAR